MFGSHCLAWAVALTGAVGVVAEEPHVQFAAGLREQGLADLALEYLERLAADPPPGLAPSLPLELARARLEAAAREPDDLKRGTQLRAARAAFEQFLDTEPEPQLAVQANFDLAKLIVLQGKQAVSQARRQESATAKQDGLAAAGQLFAEAADRMTAAGQAITAQIQRAGEPTTPEQKKAVEALQRASREAELEAAVLIFQRALTYPDTDTKMLKRRADEIAKARKELDKISGKYADDPVGYLARVWSGQCLVELDNAGDAKKQFESVVKDRVKPAAADAVRAAEFRLLEMLDKNQQVKTRVQDVYRGCNDWLRSYPKHHDTPEGQGVRYLLAMNLEEQARAQIRPGRDNVPVFGGNSKAMVIQAEKLLRALAESDNDYTARARRRRAGLLALLTSEKLAVGVSALNNFEECFLAAQVDAYELSQPAEPDRPQMDRGQRLKRVIESLTRAQTLVTKADPPRDVFESRLMLAYAHLAADDPYRAAVLAEHLSRTNTGRRGAEAAAYALQAHAKILAESRAEGTPEEVEADRARVRELARFMEATWPDEPATDAARHQLAMLMIEEAHYADAADLLARIRPGYPALAYARFQQGVAAQQAQRDEKITAERKTALLRQAIADFDQLTTPPEGASLESVLGYAQAKMQQATLVLLDKPDAKKYEQVERLGGDLLAGLPKLIDPNDERLPQLLSEASRLRTAGAQGRAFLLLRDDKFDDAKKLIGPLVQDATREFADAVKSPNKEEAWFSARLRTVRESLLLDLRSNIRQGHSDAARKSLEALNKAAAAVALEPIHQALLRLVLDMKFDLERAREAGQNDRVARLEKGLIGFLDGLAGAADLTDESRFFVAQAFTSLEQHEKAAKMLAGVPEAKPDDEAGTRTYRAARLALARAYRSAKQFAKADEVLRPILGTAAQRGWGFNDLEVNREVVALLEDRENLNGAVRHCQEMQRRLQGQIGQNDRLKEWYFDFYFHEMRLIAKAAGKQGDPAARDRLLRAVASRLVKLEQRQPDYGGPTLAEKYRDLLAGDAALKSLYKSEGGKLLE